MRSFLPHMILLGMFLLIPPVLLYCPGSAGAFFIIAPFFYYCRQYARGGISTRSSILTLTISIALMWIIFSSWMIDTIGYTVRTYVSGSGTLYVIFIFIAYIIIMTLVSLPVYLLPLFLSKLLKKEYIVIPLTVPIIEYVLYDIIRFPVPFYTAYFLGKNDPAMQLASVFGLHGTGFILLVSNALLFLSVSKLRTGLKKSTVPLSGFIALLIMIHLFGAARLSGISRTLAKSGESVTAMLVQSSSPLLKYLSNSENDKKMRKLDSAITDVYSKCKARKMCPDLIVFPESVFTFYSSGDKYTSERWKLFNWFEYIQKKTGAGVLFQYPEVQNKETRFNSAILLSRSRRPQEYRKKILFPIGETNPLPSVFSRRLPFTPGSENRPMRMRNFSFYTTICYEAIFPWYISELASEKIDFIVNQSNSIHFPSSKERYLHLLGIRYSAILFGLPILRANNVGITTVIDQAGRTRGLLPENTTASLVDRIPLAQIEPIYKKTGNLVVLLLFLGITMYIIRTLAGHYYRQKH